MSEQNSAQPSGPGDAEVPWAPPGGSPAGLAGGSPAGLPGGSPAGFAGGSPAGFRPAGPAAGPFAGPAAGPFAGPARRPPAGTSPAGYRAPVLPASPLLKPSRIDPVPGTPFGLAYFTVPPTVAGLSVASLVAGIGSILVSTVVACFGVAGASGGWGPLVGGAFAVLAVVVGVAGIGLGVAGRRQIRRSEGQQTGRGLAMGGIVCGACGVGLTMVALVAALLIAQ